MIPIPSHHRAYSAFPKLRFAAVVVLLSLGIAPCMAEPSGVDDPPMPRASNPHASVAEDEPLLTLAQRLTHASLAVDETSPPSQAAPSPGSENTSPATAAPVTLLSSAARNTPAPGVIHTSSPADRLPLGPRTVANPSTRNETEATPTGSALWSMGSVGQTLAALALVLGLIFLMRWLLRQWAGSGAIATSGGSGGKVVEVLSRSAISAKSSILVLRVGHRLLVVNDTPTGMNTLATIEDPDEIATILNLVHTQRPGSISGQFRQMLDHFNGKYEGQLHPEIPKTLADLDDPGSDETEIVTDRSRDEVTRLLTRLRRMNTEAGRA